MMHGFCHICDLKKTKRKELIVKLFLMMMIVQIEKQKLNPKVVQIILLLYPRA